MIQLTNEFTVPVGVDEAFRVLRDIERVAPCMPGAALELVDGDVFTGTVKVKVGPMSFTYGGEARYVDVDEAARTASIEAKGREIKGGGTASALVRARLEDRGSNGTLVEVRTELNITGKPAQFGRGLMADVGDNLLSRFADCLAYELQRNAAQPEAGQSGSAESTAVPSVFGDDPTEEHNSIDVFAVAGAPVLKRLIPVLVVIVAVVLIVLRLRS